MTDNRKTELLPCPFSGDCIWEPFSVKWTNCLGDVSYSATVICEACNHGIKCEIRTESAGYKTPEEAKAAIVAILNSRSFDKEAIAATLGSKISGDTSDGYHTFNELYHHRAVLFSVIVRDHRELAWKSRKHHDGTMYDGMFIVGIETPKGQATYHYDINPYWKMFDCEELEYAPEWDGHTPDDAIARIAELKSKM